MNAAAKKEIRKWAVLIALFTALGDAGALLGGISLTEEASVVVISVIIAVIAWLLVRRHIASVVKA